MNNIQINGQRRWGPPEDWTGPSPPHGTEVFIKNLPEEVFELELYMIFSKVSTVYEVRLPVNWDGLNKGYAFVRFTTIRGANQAIDRFDGYQIRINRRIRVSRSVDNTRLFLSAVPTDKNAEELKSELLNYVENVKKVYVYPTLENRSVFRGYAFVEFETHRDAAIAKRILTPDVCCGIFQRKCVASWANPLPFLDQSILNTLNVLFMRNIPKDIKGFHLKKIVETLIGGEIKGVKKLNDFAFLTFKDHKTAKRALNCLKSIPYLIPDREMQVEWAIPREVVSNSVVDKECSQVNSSKKSLEKAESTFDYDYQITNNFPSSIDYPTYIPEFSDRKDTFLCSNTFEKQDMISCVERIFPNMEITKSCGKNKVFPGLSGKHPDSSLDTHTVHTTYALNKKSPEYSQDEIFDSSNNFLLSGEKKKSIKKPEQEYFMYPNICTPSRSKISRSVDSVEGGCPFTRTFSPDSDYDSRCSEDGIMNVSRLGTSPYSPISSGPTNRSSVSSVFSCDEQDVFLPHLLNDFHINQDQLSLDGLNVTSREIPNEGCQPFMELPTRSTKGSFGTLSLHGNSEENYYEEL